MNTIDENKPWPFPSHFGDTAEDGDDCHVGDTNTEGDH